ncbi:diguanylate cyclase domain-containing protein [Undibacterium arcticum]
MNDHYGHDAGDQFLITVAARLKTAVRTTDVVGRYGGDEFVVLLKDVGAVSDVTAAEEKIRSIVEAPMTLQKHSVNVGVSIGWAMFPQDGRDADALMKVADSRMFDSKKRTQGGAPTGCIAAVRERFFSAEFHATTHRQFETVPIRKAVPLAVDVNKSSMESVVASKSPAPA